MRALIVGGSGAIGSAVARHCGEIGVETHVTVRKTSSTARLAPCPEVRRHVLDLAEPDRVADLIGSVQPDWILMSAFSSPTRTTDAAARRSLLLGMSHGLLGLLEGLRTAGFKGSLTWIGSALCYGKGDGIRRCEDPLRPSTFRGAVKSAESLLAAQMTADCGIALTELRVFTGYGPFEQRDRLIPRLLRAGLLGERVPLAVKPATRDWVHYGDIATACLASASATGERRRVFNVCSGRVHDTHQVAGLLERIVGKPLIDSAPYEVEDHYGDALPGEPPTSADGLDWSPTLDLQSGLEQCWRWGCSAEGRRYLLQDTLVPA